MGGGRVSNIIELEIVENVGILTLNRPKAANALSLTMLNRLNETLEEIDNLQLRCLIITGAGERVFCAGADLKERAGMNEIEVKQTVSLISKTMTAIEQFPMPVIAAMNGAAFGGGLELALACDIRLAGEDCKLGLTETSLGIIPGGGGTQRLPRIAGAAAAKELIFTARKITAKEALTLGILNKVVPSDQLQQTALNLAKEIAQNAPLALKAAKHAVNSGLQSDIASGLLIEAASYEQTIASYDRTEGLRAFSEKRKPVFEGR